MAKTPNSETISLRLVRQARNTGGDREGTIALLRRAWEQCKQSEKVLTAVTGTLVEIGDDDTAHSILQEAVLYQPESESLYSIIGEMALRMNIPSVAEKAFSRAFDFNPSEPSYIVNLAESLRLGEKPDAAINLLQSSLPHFPKSAGMWNALAQLTLSHLSDRENALIFQKEAVEQDPKNAAYLHNLALMYFARPEARQYYELALKQAPKNTQIHLSYSLYLMGCGDLKAAWKHYDYRLDPELGYTKAAQYTHGLPAWRGESLKGKSILLCAEQGIGDELLFGVFISRMIEEAGHVYIGCDPRLVSVYNRSFPSATAVAFEDTRHYRYRRRSFPELEHPSSATTPKADYAIPIASLPRYLAPDVETFRSFSGGFAAPDPTLRDAFAQRLAPRNRPRIAISWRSGNLKLERLRHYLSVHSIAELAASTDADFYVLQYTYTDDEVAVFADMPNVHFFQDTDLKQDIEANIALLSQMDASIGPPTATQMLAMAAGCPVMLVNKGLPWTMFGSTQMEATFAPGSKYFDFRDEKEMVALLKAHIEQAL